MLRARFGFPDFRPGQERAVTCVLDKRDTLVVLPTGGGKSICYQVPAMVLPGLTVVVSPLISLMKDQVDALTARGIPATFVNSTLSSGEVSERMSRVMRGEIKLLYLAPERFDGAILFWEEAWAQSSVIWQELHALRTAGVLDRIVGMVVGAGLELQFTPGGPANLRDIVLDVLGDRDIPVVGNVEIGHSGPNIPMPLGVRAALDADALTLSLIEPAVSG